MLVSAVQPALQKDLDRVERLAEENCLKFNKSKCRSCTWGRTPQAPAWAGADLLGGSFWGEGTGGH